MNVRRPPEAPDDLRRRPGRAFSSKYALELPPPVSGSFATLPRRRAAVAKKQAELRRQALVEVALERQIWLENAEKDRIARTIVRIARRMDGKRRAVIAGRPGVPRGARGAAVAIERAGAAPRSRRWPRQGRFQGPGRAAAARATRGTRRCERGDGRRGHRSRRRPDPVARAARRGRRAMRARPHDEIHHEGVAPPRPSAACSSRAAVCTAATRARAAAAERARQRAASSRRARCGGGCGGGSSRRSGGAASPPRAAPAPAAARTGSASAVARPPVRRRSRSSRSRPRARALPCASGRRRGGARVEEQRRWERNCDAGSPRPSPAKARVATPLQTRFRARRAARRYVAMRAAAVRIAGWRRLQLAGRGCARRRGGARRESNGARCR